jgi:hypothetical protein
LIELHKLKYTWDWNFDGAVIITKSKVGLLMISSECNCK